MINVGFIGCGAMGRDHVRRITDKCGNAQVVGVYDTVLGNAKQAIEDNRLDATIYDSADALIDDPNVDAVVIASRNDVHLDPLLHTIAIGKPTFTEKPMTINGSDSINFVVISALGAGHAYRLQAETPGSIGNVYSGPILPIDTIQGLSSARLSNILTPGDDTETDEELRARILTALNSRAFGGNVAQYVEEIEKLDGVGAVQVYPTWKGGGTVLCSVLGADWLPASADLVRTIQDAIDPIPNSGKGLGLAPIGAKVTISTPERFEILVSASVTLLPSYSMETVQSTVTAALEAYLLNIRKGWAVNISQTGLAYSASVYLARVSAAIITAEGVVNVTDVQLNGQTADLLLSQTGALQQIPVIGTVSLYEA
mgnify:CR=1 FL=1